MADNPLGRLMEMPRNPARAPGPLEKLIADATVNPLWEIAQGVGAAASGYGNSPEAGAGLMAGIGFMSPMQRLVKPIRAYHGSPHDFNKFDLSKIGTGEGAQSYGHGLYFAEKEATAKSYRDTLAPSRGKLPDDLISMPPELRKAIMTHADTDADALTAAKRAQYMASALRKDDVTKIADMIERAREAKRGRMYEVDIHARPEQFLDWDKPLADQRNIYGPLSTLGIDPSKFKNTGGQGIMREMQGDMPPPQASSTLSEAGIPGIKYLDQGSRAPKLLFDGNPIVQGRDGNHAAQMAGEALELHRNPESAVASLRRQNSPYTKEATEAANMITSGRVKYHEPQGTSNYVLFNDSIIEIMKKYGLTGAVAGPLGSLLAGGNNQAQAGQ